jgi:transposase-like protein
VISTHEEKTMSKKRRNHSPQFKAKADMVALKGDKTLAELTAEFDVHPNQITQWKQGFSAYVSYATMLLNPVGAREPVWTVRSRHDRATANAVIEMAAGDTSVGSNPNPN